ncbi:MAG: hypothetical protein ACTSUN_05015 [Promethearchaeota archaeon]
MAWSRKNAKIKNRIDKITTYCRIPLEMLPREMARLYKEQLRLDDMLFHSICACRWCGDFEADLIYNPVMKAWYCEDCYSKRQKKRPNLYPEL